MPQDLIERIPFPASLTDSRNRFVAINSAHEKLYGWSIGELEGDKPDRLLSPDVDRKLLRDVFAESGKEGWRGRLRNVNRAGKEFEIVLHTRPVWLGNQKLKLGVICLPGQEEALVRSLLELAWMGTIETSRVKVPLPLDQLTTRELEVFGLLGRGLRTAEIADQMDVSFNTARVYVAAIRRKFECPNIETLRALAARQAWGFD